MFNKYSVSVGDNLWNALYSYLKTTHPDSTENFRSVYSIEAICEENEQLFSVIKNRTNEKIYRLNFSYVEENFEANETLIEITSSYEADAEPQFSLEDVENFEKNFETTDKNDEEDINNSDNNTEGNNEEEKADEEKEKCSECGQSIEECACPKAPEYKLEEIPEYVELLDKYSKLENDYNELLASNTTLQAETDGLKQFKLATERKDKEDMIKNTFYMLSDDDKSDVIANIDKYSLDEIESKLSVICVRNKVSFNNEEDSKPTTYNLDGESEEDTNMPAWVKRALEVAQS